MANEIQVTGLAELRKSLLEELPEALQGKAAQLALAKACRPIVEAAKAKAPTRFVGPLQPGKRARGRLRDAIYSFRSPESTKTYEARCIGVKSSAWYWRFIEFGRASIERIKKGSLGTVARGFFGKKVKAVPPKPFLRPAFEENAQAAIGIFAAAILPSIEKVAKQAYTRSARRLRKAITGF